MAKFGYWRNGFLEIAGVDMSDHCQEFSVAETTDELPNDAHGGFVPESAAAAKRAGAASCPGALERTPV